MRDAYFLIIAICTFFLLPLSAQIDHWESLVLAGNQWQYFRGDTAPPSNWNTVGFSADSWLSGNGGIGYGDGDDATVITPVQSLYMRRTFTVTDLSKIEALVLHADYDDGFVAYLNGVEIARANLNGDPPAFDTWASGLREAQMYDGGLPVAFTPTPGLLQDGENVLAIQTHNYEGMASSDLTTLYWLSAAINDTSTDYQPVPPWFFDGSFDTPLPIITINTGGQNIPDEPRIEAQMGIIWNTGGSLNNSSDFPNEFDGNITIERRGQTSLILFPKNGFAFETKDENWEDMDASFLGFPEEEDWILHGPYSDKTLMRNVLTMELARSMGQYASRTRFVELIINGAYEGIYVLMERIKRDNERVDIARLREEDIAGDELTGGYIFKIDKDTPDWYSQFDMVNNPDNKLHFQYVYPDRDRIMPEQEAYIQAYVDSFEQAIALPDLTYGGKRYDEYIDLTSFAEHFIITELTKNVDGYRLSTYLHKDKDSNGGLLKAGPVWDYNLAFGNADYCMAAETEGWMYDFHCDIGNPFWWEVMFTDPVFTSVLKCRWQELREGPLSQESIFAFIDQQAATVAPALDRNFTRWPVLDQWVWPNVVVTGSYAGEVDYIKDFISDRLVWMDANMPGNCQPTASFEPVETPKISVSPNPIVDEAYLDLQDLSAGPIEVHVIDLLGRTLWSKRLTINGTSQLRIPLSTEQWAAKPSMCYLQVRVPEAVYPAIPLLLMK